MGRGRSSAQTKPLRATKRTATLDGPDYEGWYADGARNHERIAHARRQGLYVPGANGSERPFRARSGARLLWCWRPATGEHHYLNCDTDIFLSDDEANAHLGADAPARSVLPPDVRAREAASYLPLERKRSGYYKEINSNHFNAATAVGSLFTNAASLGKLLDTCILQRHSLSGDDREELIALGADAAAFREGVRYLKVITDGVGGLVNASTLDPQTPVRIVRTETAKPCSLVVEGVGPPTFVGTIIIGPNRKQQSADPPSTSECVLSAHPGFPAASAHEDVWPENSLISVDAVLTHFRALGFEDVALMVAQQPRSQPQVEGDAFSSVLGNRRGAVLLTD